MRDNKRYIGTRRNGEHWSYSFEIKVDGRTVRKEKSGYRSSAEAYTARVKAMNEIKEA